MPLTEPQKQRWLDLLRQGWDRKEASHAVGEEQSTFQVLGLNDPDFRAEMVLALQAGKRERRNNGWAPQPDGTLTEKQIQLFEDWLELIRAGKHPSEAAHELGYFFSYFEKVINPFSRTHNPDLSALYNEALMEGRPAVVERLRRLAIKAAEDGEYRAIKDLLLVHDEEWRPLLNRRVEIGNADGQPFKLAALQSVNLTGVPTDLILELKDILERIEQAKQQALEAPILELVAGDQ